MNTKTLLKICQSRGIKLYADLSTDKLIYKAAPGALTPEIRAALAEQKPWLLCISRAAQRIRCEDQEIEDQYNRLEREAIQDDRLFVNESEAA